MTDQNNSQTTPAAKDDLQNKLEEARRALEGEEHAQKREQEEKTKTLKDEVAKLEAQLADLAKQKEVLELAWVDFDTKRKAIRAILNPIVDEEKRLEEEERKIEAEESSIGVEAEKHKVEEKRWVVEAKRKELEQKKWAEEEKLIKIEATIDENTKKYRVLLDEEDKATLRLEQLKNQQV